MRMNWLDFNFWLFSPVSLWFTAASIFFLGFVLLKTTNKIIPIIPELRKIIPELERITTEFRKDTVSLNLATSEVDARLEKVRIQLESVGKSIDSWHATILRIFPWFSK